MVIKKNNFERLFKKIKEEYKGPELCSYYFSFLANQEESEDLKLLRVIVSYHLKPKNILNPLGAFLILEGGRSNVPNDLSGLEIKKLIKYYINLENSELKARLADILWLKERNIKYANEAINAYISSSKKIRSFSWNSSLDRIERAFRLSITLGKGGTENLKNVINHINEILSDYDLEEEPYLPLKLIELITEIKDIDASNNIKILESCISFFESKKDFQRCNDYLDLLAKSFDKIGNKKLSKEKRINIAENYVKLQELENSFIGKSRYYSYAIEIYRRIGGNRERQNELHLLLLETQKKIKTEMKVFSLPSIDLTDSIKNSIHHVSNYSKKESLIRFCLISNINNIKDSFDHVEEQSTTFISRAIFKQININKEGKTISYSAETSKNDLPREERLYPHLVEYLGHIWKIVVSGSILPAKVQIMLEHDILEDDIKEFTNNNPLIRNGHENLFVQGILFGFEGKWELAGMILALQFEDSLRYLLEKKGVITSNIKNNFTQEELGTSYFFKYHSKELKEIFGEDIFYELKILLVKDENGHGINYRNLVAHSILNQNEYYSENMVYLWWLILRLVCMPLIKFEIKNK